MTIKRYEALYDPGGIETGREDWLFSNPFSPFHMVYDGASPRDEKGKKVWWGNQTVSWHCGRIAHEVCSTIPQDFTPRQLLLAANGQVRRWQRDERKTSLHESENLGGGTVAAIKIEAGRLLVAWVSDCVVLMAKKNGELWSTRNHAYDNDVEEMAIVDSLMEKHGGNREAMWTEFSPILRDFRRRHINKKVSGGYGILNGQPGFAEVIEEVEFPLEEVAVVLLFTDGATSLEDSRDPQILAQKTWERYQRGGLRGIVQEARAEKDPNSSYVSYDEATLIGIEFG